MEMVDEKDGTTGTSSTNTGTNSTTSANLNTNTDFAVNGGPATKPINGSHGTVDDIVIEAAGLVIGKRSAKTGEDA